MSVLANREQILALQDIGYQDINMDDIPGWQGVTIRVKDLTGAERDKLEAGLVEEKQVRVGKKVKTRQSMNLANVRARFCAACIVDEAMQVIFNADDVQQLGRKSAIALDRIFAVIKDRNGLSDEDVDELAGNFTNGQGDASLIA